MAIIDSDAHVIDRVPLTPDAESGKVPAASAGKILDTNARVLYGL